MLWGGMGLTEGPHVMCLVHSQANAEALRRTGGVQAPSDLPLTELPPTISCPERAQTQVLWGTEAPSWGMSSLLRPQP